MTVLPTDVTTMNQPTGTPPAHKNRNAPNVMTGQKR